MFENKGISYITHPQASPITVTDFKNIEKITTSILQITTIDQNQYKTNKDDVTRISSCFNKISDDSSMQCSCNEIKTLLKIKVVGNLDDLTISCSGVNTADNIADLVDGYCRLVNNTEISYWDRTQTQQSEVFEKSSAMKCSELKDQLNIFEPSSHLHTLTENSNSEKCKFVL